MPVLASTIRKKGIELKKEKFDHCVFADGCACANAGKVEYTKDGTALLKCGGNRVVIGGKEQAALMTPAHAARCTNKTPHTRPG